MWMESNSTYQNFCQLDHTLQKYITHGNVTFIKHIFTIAFDREAALATFVQAEFHTATSTLSFHNKIKLILMH